MSDDLIGKFLSASKQASTGVGNEPPSHASSDAPARPFMIDFETQSGTRHAFPYAQLLWATLSPSHGIKLSFATHNVVIRGRCLEPLFASVCEHTASRITATGERHDPGEGTDRERPVVHRILVRKPRRSAT